MIWLQLAHEDIDPAKAASVYTEILNSILKLKQNIYYNEIVLRHKMAMQFEILGNYDRALEECRIILHNLSINESDRDRLEDRLERVEEMKEHLEAIR